MNALARGVGISGACPLTVPRTMPRPTAIAEARSRNARRLKEMPRILIEESPTPSGLVETLVMNPREGMNAV